ncbi:hypothetical protein ACLKA6_002178 [Drosophila palustris]
MTNTDAINHWPVEPQTDSDVDMDVEMDVDMDMDVDVDISIRGRCTLSGLSPSLGPSSCPEKHAGAVIVIMLCISRTR